jgi:hypothetical protein
MSKGGYGKGWGGHWGGAEPEEVEGPFEAFAEPLYPVPFGKELGSVRIGRGPFFHGIPVVPPPGPPQQAEGSSFSGEWPALFTPPTGPFLGAIFFAPSLLSFVPSNEIDLDYIRVTVQAGDFYEAPVQENVRTFTFGPSSPSRTNDFLYRVQPDAYTAVGTMVQTIPPGPTTIFQIT